MEKAIKSTTLKRLRNRYRLVIMNEDTYEEVVTFTLNRVSVYMGMSIIFVLLFSLTVALLSFTNLKYLIPGYGKQNALLQLRELKVRIDSLEQTLLIDQQYFNGIKKVLKDNDTPSTSLDTAILQIPKTEEMKE